MTDFNSRLGMALEGDAVVLETKPEHEVAPGMIHFAVLATMAEVAAARSVGSAVMPAQISLSLLSVASPGRLEARGAVLRRGKRLCVAEGEVRQGESLVAKAVVTFAVAR